MDAEIEAAGALVTASLVAGEIESGKRAAGAANEHAEATHAPCANCGAPLTGRFCQACGQSAHLHHSLWHLAEEVLHGVLHFDAKGFRTLPLLVARPGLLTRRYIDGQRTRHVSPLALFLFSMFLMFFVFSLTGGSSTKVELASPEERAEIARDSKEAAEALDPDEAQPASQASAAASGVSTSASSIESPQIPATTASKEKSDFEKTLAKQMKNPELALYKLKNTAYKFSFMLIPISLPFLWLMFFWRRGVRVYDHAVFSLYSLSFMALFFSTLAVLSATAPDLPLWPLFLFVPPLHMFVQLRGTYGLVTFSAMWRTGALLVVAGTVFLTFLVFIAVMSAR